MKKLFLLICALIILKTACTDAYRADITIRECITSTGQPLTVPVEISINGEMKTWQPGSQLTFLADIGGDIGFIEVSAEADGYLSKSPRLFEVDREHGLEIILTFAATVPMEGEIVHELTDIDRESITTQNIENPNHTVENDEVEEKPNFGTLEIQSIPSDLILFVSLSGHNEIQTFRTEDISQIPLLPGEYQWTAESEGYITRHGIFQIEENSVTQRTITLEEEIEDGSLLITAVPENAVIEVTSTATGDIYTLNSGEAAVFSPGTYSYSVFLSGYLEEEGALTLDSGQTREIVEELTAVSVNQLVEQIRGFSGLSEAIRIYESLPEEVPALTISQRINYIDALYSLATYLIDNNERDRAEGALQYVLDINPRYIEARWLLAEILTLQQDYDMAITILRPTMGAYSNDLDEPQRSEVRLETRYRLATIYFDRYQSLDQSNINERERVGDRALTALSDFIERYHSYGEPEHFRSNFETAKVIRRNISADLGR